MSILSRGLALLLAALLVAPLAAQDGKAIDLFDGKDTKGWKLKGDAKRSKWIVGKASLAAKDDRTLDVEEGGTELINKSTGVDIYTEQKFGDCIVEVEFMVPKGSNSGIYLMGEYEVQILDSYGKKGKLTQGDLGAIYSARAPSVNAAKKPGEWQKFVIDFQAPRFEGSKKVKNALFLKVTLNDVVIQENVEVTKGSTGGGLTGREAPTGPLMFQGDHGPVAFRNIKITPKATK